MKRKDFLRLVVISVGLTTAFSWIITLNELFAIDIYPTRKITWISHTQPGSGYDIIPRVMAPYLSKYLKEVSPGCKGGDIVIKNEPSGGGRKAFTDLFRSAPDGYTIGGLDIAFITDLLSEKIGFDVASYSFLAKLDSQNKMIVTNKNGFNSWDEAVKMSKKTPLKIAVGQFGRGNHTAGILLKETLGLNAIFINTQSTAGNIAMIIRGDVHAGIVSEDAISNVLQSKEVKVLLTYKETDDYPGSVSLKQLGFPDIGEYAYNPRFAVGPPGLPKEIKNKLIEALKRTIMDKKIQEWSKQQKVKFTPLYGDEAREIAKKRINFYQSNEAMMRKHLQE